jgi:hypothetical protein
VRADLERVVLGVDAEGVEAERLEDVVPLQPVEASEMSLPVNAKRFPTCSPSALGYGNIMSA